MATTTFGHISDPHLPLSPGVPRPFRMLAGKRLFAFLSWQMGKRQFHQKKALQAICDDIAPYRLDHLLVTGDLTNLALPEEFSAARAWLGRLGDPDRVSVVPGNHDLTVALPRQAGLAHWQPWMRGDADADNVTPAFPFIRRRGLVAFINLSSAVATPPLIASGRLGSGQIERVKKALQQTQQAGLFRVVALHHPPLAGVISTRKGLQDGHRFREMLAVTGAELVVHGHCHRPTFGYLTGPAGPIPVVGVPSASAAPERAHDRHARWHLFRVSRTAEGWSLSLTVRGLRQDGLCRGDGGWTMAIPAAGSNAGADGAPVPAG